MKKVFLFVLMTFLLCACEYSPKTEVISFYLYSEGSSFEYGDLIIEVSKIDGDCLSESTCTVDDNISILVNAGIGNQTEDYNISNDGEYTKINGTNNYLKLDVKDGNILVVVCE